MYITAVRTMKDSIRDLIYGKKIRSFKVLNHLPLLLDGGEASTAEKMKELWDIDPVHLVQDEYPRLLQGILDISDEGTLTRPSRDHAPGNAVNPRLYKRKPWVDSDDNLAHRNYGVDWRRDNHSRPDIKYEDAATAADVGVAHVVTSEGATELAATGAGPTSSFFKCLSYRIIKYM
jgi:hypothetical protein